MDRDRDVCRFGVRLLDATGILSRMPRADPLGRPSHDTIVIHRDAWALLPMAERPAGRYDAAGEYVWADVPPGWTPPSHALPAEAWRGYELPALFPAGFVGEARSTPIAGGVVGR